jgi:ABC-type uncharacterized transport system substrate-binding protein
MSVRIWKSAPLVLLVALLWGVSAAQCRAAEILVIGDTRLKPVMDTVAGIRKSCHAAVKSYTPGEVAGRLRTIYEEQGARLVIALGSGALDEALTLPTSIPVIYGLVVTPPSISRANTTGFYVATPVSEYAEMANRIGNLGSIRVVGSEELLRWLAREQGGRVTIASVGNSLELIAAVRRLDTGQALLLLPDVSLLTTTAMEQAYLLCLQKRVPVLGISEKHVKQGALLALVFEPAGLGRQLGEQASRVLRRGSAAQIPPAPPRKFDLFVNLDTAKRLGIRFPDEVLRSAKRIYR